MWKEALDFFGNAHYWVIKVWGRLWYVLKFPLWSIDSLTWKKTRCGCLQHGFCPTHGSQDVRTPNWATGDHKELKDWRWCRASIECMSKFLPIWDVFSRSKNYKLAVYPDVGVVKILEATEWVEMLFENPKKISKQFLNAPKTLLKQWASHPYNTLTHSLAATFCTNPTSSYQLHKQNFILGPFQWNPGYFKLYKHVINKSFRSLGFLFMLQRTSCIHSQDVLCEASFSSTMFMQHSKKNCVLIYLFLFSLLKQRTSYRTGLYQYRKKSKLKPSTAIMNIWRFHVYVSTPFDF